MFEITAAENLHFINTEELLNDLMRHGGLVSLMVFFTFVVVGILFLLQLLGKTSSPQKQLVYYHIVLGNLFDFAHMGTQSGHATETSRQAPSTTKVLLLSSHKAFFAFLPDEGFCNPELDGLSTLWMNLNNPELQTNNKQTTHCINSFFGPKAWSKLLLEVDFGYRHRYLHGGGAGGAQEQTSQTI